MHKTQWAIDPVMKQNNYPSGKRWQIKETESMMTILYKPVSVIYCFVTWIAMTAFIHFISRKMEMPFIGILGSVFAGLAILIILLIERNQKKKGDWLIVDKGSKTISFPRYHQKMNLSSLKALQIIVGNPVFPQDWFHTEVNCLMVDNGKYVRIPLMRAQSPNLINNVKSLFSKKMNIPIQQVKYRSGKPNISGFLSA